MVDSLTPSIERHRLWTKRKRYDRKKIEKGLAAISAKDAYQQALARARVFTQERLWYDALDAYSDLIARYPDRAELYETRGTIYAQFPVTQPLADRGFARADELEAIKKK